MAERSLKPCMKIGCRELTRSAYCEKHQAERDAELALKRADYDKVRGPSSQRGYGSSHKARRDSLLKNSPLCYDCLRLEGRPVPATVYHHIDGNQFNISEDNKMSLCRECHEIRHGRLKRVKVY